MWKRLYSRFRSRGNWAGLLVVQRHQCVCLIPGNISRLVLAVPSSRSLLRFLCRFASVLSCICHARRRLEIIVVCVTYWRVYGCATCVCCLDASLAASLLSESLFVSFSAYEWAQMRSDCAWMLRLSYYCLAHKHPTCCTVAKTIFIASRSVVLFRLASVFSTIAYSCRSLWQPLLPSYAIVYAFRHISFVFWFDEVDSSMSVWLSALFSVSFTWLS